MCTLNLWFIVLVFVFILSVATACIGKAYKDKRMRNVGAILMLVSLGAICIFLFS